jgi:hypothetical protein
LVKKSSNSVHKGTSSIFQLVHVLQQSLARQQTLVAHLIAHRLAYSAHEEHSASEILEYLKSESLLDEKQI